MSSSSSIGDAQTRQGPFTTSHWNLRLAPRQKNYPMVPEVACGQRWFRFILQSFRPLVLAVASLSSPDISDAQTNCGACWTTVTNWQGTYTLTVTGTGVFDNGTFQVNDSSQGSFVLTNAFGVTNSTVKAGTLNGTGSINVSGSSPCNPGEETCSTTASGSLEGAASVSLQIDTTNCTYQIGFSDVIAGSSEQTGCDGGVNQFSVVVPASGGLATPPGTGLIGVLPSFPLPAYGEALTESGGTYAASFIGVSSVCGASGSFTLTISWNIQPEISTGAPQFTQVPTGGSLGCNPTNIPNAQSVLNNTQATAPSGMVSLEADTVDSTNGCSVTRTFTLTATDDCSQEQAQATVAYSWTDDTNAPVITSVPPGANLGCNPSTPPTDATIQSQVTASDNCGTAMINVSHTDTTNTCTVTRTFTITAADGCSNVSPPQMVIYTWTADTTPPTFTELPPGGNLGNNPPSVPNDATIQAMTQATDNCGVASIMVTHMDSGTSPVTRTFTITATDGCGNKTTTTVAYTWTGTVGGGGGTNSAPILEIVRLGTNVVLFWPTNAAAYSLQSDTNLTVTNAWSNLTNIPEVSGGTNYVTNPITGSTLFYRLFFQ